MKTKQDCNNNGQSVSCKVSREDHPKRACSNCNIFGLLVISMHLVPGSDSNGAASDNPVTSKRDITSISEHYRCDNMISFSQTRKHKYC